MKTKTTKKKDTFSIKLPAVITANDYHDFPAYNILFEELGMGVRCEEVGFDCKNGQYVGIAHLKRKKLTNSVVDSMIPYHIRNSYTEDE